jgi:hypothetical protein
VPRVLSLVRWEETYDRGVNAIEAVLTEAENETFVYDPDTDNFDGSTNEVP